MYRQTFFIIIVIISFISCKKDQKTELQNEINYREKIFVEAKKGGQQPSKEDYFLIIETYEDYYNNFPEDTLSPLYLYKSAIKFVEIEKYGKAVKNLDLLAKNYNSYKKLPEILFFKAFLQEEKLGENENAIRSYKELIKQFPEDKLSKDAALLIEMIENNN